MKNRKPLPITRRNFIQRAGLLISSLGVSSAVQANLMDSLLTKSSKALGSNALAQGAGQGPVHFMVEICIYLGHQFNSLLATRGHKMDAVRSPQLNFYSSQGMIEAYKPASARAQDIFVVKYPMDVLSNSAVSGGQNFLSALQTINATGERVGVATTEMFAVPDVVHRTNFIARAPNGAAPCPAILHAALAPPAPVQAVHWNSSPSIVHQVGSVDGLQLRGLSAVTTPAQFTSQFRPLPMFFTSEEYRALAGTFDSQSGDLVRDGVVDSFDQAFLTRNVPGSSGVYESISKPGRNQATLNRVQNIQQTFDAQASKFPQIGMESTGGMATVSDERGQREMGALRLQTALNYAAAAFNDGAMTTMVISMQESDWHGKIPQALDNAQSIQGLWNAYMGNALAGFLRACAELTDPFTGHQTRIIDSLLINVTSEFTRTPDNRNRTNNDDGGSWGGYLIGTNVNTGSYGNITGMATTESFNRETGVLSAGAPAPTQAMWYKTSLNAMGVPKSSIDAIMPMPGDSLGGYIPAMVKNV